MGRPGLEFKTRSLLNLVMLTALNRQHELSLHVRGAVNNGCTVEEIREALIQAAVYAACLRRSRLSASPRPRSPRWARPLLLRHRGSTHMKTEWPGMGILGPGSSLPVSSDCTAIAQLMESWADVTIRDG